MRVRVCVGDHSPAVHGAQRRQLVRAERVDFVRERHKRVGVAIGGQRGHELDELGKVQVDAVALNVVGAAQMAVDSNTDTTTIGVKKSG